VLPAVLDEIAVGRGLHEHDLELFANLHVRATNAACIARRAGSNVAPVDTAQLVSIESIANRILAIRGLRVMLDVDLAQLYAVSTKRLNEQVKRNRERFPHDFMFRLSAPEAAAVNRSQFATGSSRHRDPRARPYVFTEHGCLMLANVLRSRRAAQVSVRIVRAFIRLREVLASDFAAELTRHARQLETHEGILIDLMKRVGRGRSPVPQPP